MSSSEIQDVQIENEDTTETDVDIESGTEEITEDEVHTEESVVSDRKPDENEQGEEVIKVDLTLEPESDQVTHPEHVTEQKEEPMEVKLALLKKFSSDYFLNKHSSSFKCLEQFLCSRSDLRLTLNFFPSLADPGLDAALNYIPPEEEPDPNGCDKYIKMCKYLNIVPIKRVINSLNTDTLNLKYYGLTLKQMRGIADALKVNTNIESLILQDNWMSPEAASLISEILRESHTIQVLNLKECRIGPDGAEKLCEGIASTQFLQELDLSFNSLGDNGLKMLQPSLIENSSIKKLNISHNELTEESGETLEQILLQNKTLEELDLSWNGFYTGPGNKKLCNGLAKNETLSSLKLAWNGIGTGLAMRPITKYLRKAETLKFLDLSWNRITQQALKLLRTALLRNKSLQHVKLGNNTYTPDEAYFLTSFLNKSGNIEYLDLEDMCVNKDFLQLKNQLRRKGKTVKHGHVLSNYKIYGPNVSKLLFERCRYLAMKPKKKKMKKDFGHFVLSLPDKPITTQEFQDCLKKKKVKKIDKDLLKELMAIFPGRNKRVDCVEMKAAYMNLYPDTVLPEEKKKKKKGKKRKKKKE